MTSPTPLFFDTCYHIYNRGINGGDVFIEERNYEYFLRLYASHVEPIAHTYAYCLLKNHFHLLVRIKTQEEIDPLLQTLRVSETLRDSFPSKKFSDFFNAYAKSINKTYGRTGSLFQHPFGRVVVKNDRQFSGVITYIHQNPQKHKFVSDFRDWKHSSYATVLSNKPTRLERDAVLDWFGGIGPYRDLHNEWVDEGKSRWFAADDID